MTTDATRPRQRFSGDGWSSAARDGGEFDFVVSAKLAELSPAGPGAGRVVPDLSEAGGRVIVPAVVRPAAWGDAG